MTRFVHIVHIFRKVYIVHFVCLAQVGRSFPMVHMAQEVPMVNVVHMVLEIVHMIIVHMVRMVP
jgi:hypothetical protein